MANQFVAIPAPAANGSGAAVDVSSFGALKTFTVADIGGAFVTIEMCNQLVPLNWAPLAMFTAGGEKTVVAAARWIRATVSKYAGGGAPDVNLGGDDSGASFVELVAPAGNGDGAGVDTSALPPLKTIQVTGAFKGAVNIEVSEDGGGSYVEKASFRGPGFQTFVAAAEFMRVKRNGIVFPNGPTPTVNIAACEPVGGETAIGLPIQDEGVAVATATTLNFIGDGVTATDAGGGVVDVAIVGAADAAAGPRGDGTLADKRFLRAGYYDPTSATFLMEDLYTTANVTLAIDGAPSEIQQFNNQQYTRGAVRLRPQAIDSAYATVVFNFQSGAGSGSGWGLYAINQMTHGFFQFRATSSTQEPQPGDDFTEIVGMLQDPASVGQAGRPFGAYFMLNTAANGNSNWWVVIHEGGGAVVYANDTGVAFDFGSLHTFGIEYRWPNLGSGGEDMHYTFFLDGVQVGDFSAPVIIMNSFAPMVGIGNSQAGQAGIRVCYADYFIGWSEEDRMQVHSP